MRPAAVAPWVIFLAGACSSSPVVVLPECGGWVVDALTGQPVEGAMVRPARHDLLGRVDAPPTRTDASGLFGFPLRMGGPASRAGGGVMTAGVTLEVLADGYQPAFTLVEYRYPSEKQARPAVAFLFRDHAPLPDFLARCALPGGARHAWTLASEFARILGEPWFAEMSLQDAQLADRVGTQLRLELQPLFKTCGLTVEQDALVQDTWRIPLDRHHAARSTLQ